MGRFVWYPDRAAKTRYRSVVVMRFRLGLTGCDRRHSESNLRPAACSRKTRDSLEFLQDDNLDGESSLLDSKPRMLIAAGGFDDRQITTCVLWLRSFGVDISCVEVSPYRLNGDKRLFLVPRVIIPLPEAANYIEGVEAKEIEQSQSRMSATQQEYKSKKAQ